MKNYVSRFGEIDLIAIRDKYIYFIEVKFRQNYKFGTPKEAVIFTKQQKIVKTAMFFLSLHKTELQPKFVVIEIFRNLKNEFVVNFLDDAFEIKNELDIFKRY